MKTKILILAAVVLFVVSCGTKKAAPTTPATPAVTQAAKPTTLTPELAEGKNLYENSCARCHKLYDPKKFSQEDWKPILVRMQKKAKLDDTQMASISNYITSQL
ncbi:diheme cytochrome c [Flavobacterium sp. 90]|uniref:cytochrome c n=1 Tax=unclassified Flavobacterium TaxID=196869 RepID=UPI000EAC99F4|nr:MULTISPECIES: cytochrome c [unclassified Flavobacterium]RKR08734.1 diheme cytochrome c [Flavobacterium sp. 81]TCK52521.1 diheme cytochrome c [Flavobacterium sp. 90]